MLAADPSGLDAGGLLTTAVTNLGGEATIIIGAALGLGVSILAVRRGFAWVKSFAK